MERTIDGGALGVVILRHSLRATHYSIRIQNGQVIGIIPQGGNEREMLTYLDEQRYKLIRMLQESPKPPPWDEQMELQTYTFRLHIFRTPRTNFYMTLKDGILHIACPEDTDFENEQTQQTLRTLFDRALHHEAIRILPARLKMLADRHHFSYTGVTIRNTKTRWGSCTSKKRISLSISLMLLPEHLIDYVLLHELCHTVEMNHGERFWQLMNRVTGGSAQALRRELKRFFTN
jgi:predicted metal-dependent hydrolase